MKGLWVALVALAFGACVPDFAERGNASVILRITKINGSSGGGAGASGIGDVLNSDVCCPVVNDNAELTFQVIPKNQGQSARVFPGNLSDVELEQYEVRYFRSDGQNTEGVDVPYRITGAMATVAPFGTNAVANIVVVRHQAKIEPPLKNLTLVGAPSFQGAISGGAIVLTTMAEITVRGHTTAGHAVEARGALQINFADFGE